MSLRNWCLLFIIFPIVAFCSSPRLLITLGPKCDFGPEKLQKAMKIRVVSGSEDDMKEEVDQLDISCQDHIIVLGSPVEDIARFSWLVGYETIHLDESFEKAIKKLEEFIPTIPTTDAYLPRMNEHEAGRFYDLIMKVDKVFKEHNLLYWAAAGTVLGTVRHQGMIPWDDDIDISIHEKDIPILVSLKEALADVGLELVSHHELDNLYKIFPVDGMLLPREEGGFFPWKHPFVDVLPMTTVEGKLVYACEQLQKVYSNEYVLPEQVRPPLKTLPFGPMEIPVPRNPIDYVVRSYGEDWNRMAYVFFDHKKDCAQKKIKVELVDRSAPKYVLPAR